MTKTVYKTPPDWPNDSQVTTARDQAILGRAMQERFPTYTNTSSPLLRVSPHTLGNLTIACSVTSKRRPATPCLRLQSRDLAAARPAHVVAVVLGGSSAAIGRAHARAARQYVPSAATSGPPR